LAGDLAARTYGMLTKMFRDEPKASASDLRAQPFIIT
jgi:hypothetical protein